MSSLDFSAAKKGDFPFKYLGVPPPLPKTKKGGHSPGCGQSSEEGGRVERETSLL